MLLLVSKANLLAFARVVAGNLAARPVL